MVSVPEEDVRVKVDEYSNFVRDVLRPKLATIELCVEEVKQEIEEYNDLRCRLNEMIKLSSNGNKSDHTVKVDLGFEKVFSIARIENSSGIETIFVDVGMGLHIELTISEAMSFIDNRIKFLKEQKLSNRIERFRQTTQHIKTSEMILDEMSKELSRMS